ncbi:MAG: asparagine synthase (glutamine-hydrolyzing) [Saprospiraceae bacterium]
MCGIAGIINRGQMINLHEPIDAMTNRIAHRGPDAHRVYADHRVALGHRRLSIIDLSESANQPMTDHSGRYLIIYNGEIYNYAEVKSTIKNYPFRTDSDTEVILAAYILWGPSCLDKLNGMFALAIWDKQEETLFIARDRLGKKPLYYYHADHLFVFGSEIRSLLSSGLVPHKLSKKYLPEFLMYQAPMDSHSLVENVVQLKAGHFAMIKNNQVREERYWNYETIEPYSGSYETIKKGVKDLFIDSVRLRMVSDVPVGAFLSGGIDSSLIVACMAELTENPINTFNVGFQEKDFDESGYADLIADKYKTNHHRISIDPNEFLYSLDEILAAIDSPSGDGPNTYLVAKHTSKQGLKVALSGLGGDELFAGYNKFSLYKKIISKDWILNIPLFLRKPLSDMIRISQGRDKLKMADILLLKQWNLGTIYPALRRSYRSIEAESILSGGVTEDYVQSKLQSIEKEVTHLGYVSQCTIGELESYTRDVLLRDTDQMAMAHALEVRVPFFDYRLVEFVLSLPDESKMQKSTKQLLVDALAPRLPQAISSRKKMGFTFPIKKWLNHELHEMADQKIGFLADRKEFNGSAMINMWQRFQQGDNRIAWPQIWQLIVLSDWLERNKL